MCRGNFREISLRCGAGLLSHVEENDVDDGDDTQCSVITRHRREREGTRARHVVDRREHYKAVNEFSLVVAGVHSETH